MALTMFILSFFILLLIGVPIAFSMILPSFLYLLIADLPISVVAQRLFDPLTSPSFLAIPFYILTAEILNATNATQILFQFARKVIGFIPGGLGQANVLASMIFAGMSGSASADAGGLGRIEITAMKEAKYDLKYSVGITASSSVIGPIIPPSIPFAVYGIMASQSIAKLFVAGILPGITMGLCLMAMTFYIAIKNPKLFPRDPIPKGKEILIALKDAFWTLLIPIIIIGGILSGKFTPTEAGSVAILCAIVISIFYKTFSLKLIAIAFRNAMRSTVVVMFILGAALVFSWVVTISQLPQIAIHFIFTITTSKTEILLLIAVLILIMGMFMSANACLIIIAPLLVELAPLLNIDLIHMGVFLVLGCMIGVITPPIGGVLFILSDYTGLSISEITKGTLPFLIALIISWLIVIFVPETTLFLPKLLWG